MKTKNHKAGRIRSSQKTAYMDEEGLIVAHLGVAVEVLFPGGERRQVRVKRSSGHVVGDGVTVKGEVLRRLPRRTELRRLDTNGKPRLVGANLDVLAIVVAPLPVPPAGFIDRAIVAARAAGLHPFIVINKCDLDGVELLIEYLAETYAGSVPMFALSAATGDGLDPMLTFLAEGHRCAFVGTTGVGKSSLLNTICPDIDLKIGEISDYGQGRHTTSVATLHQLPEGGELIDTPGFRDFGLVDILPQELADHFPGFEPTKGAECRFRDCRHRTEPGCAVVELLEHHEVPEDRYDTYLELLDEVEAAEEEAKRRGWRT